MCQPFCRTKQSYDIIPFYPALTFSTTALLVRHNTISAAAAFIELLTLLPLPPSPQEPVSLRVLLPVFGRERLDNPNLLDPGC